jgi:hypothetical protein
MSFTIMNALLQGTLVAIGTDTGVNWEKTELELIKFIDIIYYVPAYGIIYLKVQTA